MITPCLWVLTASLVAAQDIGSLARGLSDTYKRLKSFSVTVKYESEYKEDFMKYREEAGYSLALHSPTSSGVVTYLAKGGRFACDQRVWWGDGTLMKDRLQAWDGAQWQFLNRMTPPIVRLELTRQRGGRLEVGAHAGSPLEWAFPFLSVVPARREDGSWSEDDHLYAVTLDRMQDEREWQSLAQRLRGKVQRVDYKGERCWRFGLNAGVARGDRHSKIYYMVWLPVAASAFPLRVENRDQDDNYLIWEFEVREFFDPVEIEPGVPLRFPRKFRSTSYTNDPLWLGRVVHVEDFEYLEHAFNPVLPDDKFQIPYELATQVRQTEAGRIIHRKPN